MEEHLKIHYQDLFSTRVYQLLLRNHTTLNKHLTKYVNKYIEENSDPIVKSNYGGYHSKSNLQIEENESVVYLKSFIINSMNAVISDDHPWYIENNHEVKDLSGFWFTRNKKGHFNFSHAHVLGIQVLIM